MKQRKRPVMPSGAPITLFQVRKPVIALDYNAGVLKKVTGAEPLLASMRKARPQTAEFPVEDGGGFGEIVAKAQAAAEGYEACLPRNDDNKILCYRTDCVDTRRGGEWKLLEFDVCIASSGRSKSGATVCEDQRYIRRVKHWVDLQAAEAWAQEAWRLVNQEARMRALDSTDLILRMPNSQERMDALRNRYEAQVDYVREVFNAIAQFYNALNIPWSADPVAREIYRKYLAGTADTTAEYQKESDYNEGNWYSKRELGTNASNYPFISQQPGSQQGILVRKARTLHKSLDPGVANTHFRQRAGVRLEASGADWRDPMKDPYVMGQNPRNVGFASPIGLGTVRMPRAGTAATATAYDPSPRSWDDDQWHRRWTRTPEKAQSDSQIQDGQYVTDWRAFSWSSYVNATNTQQAGAPLRDYLEWANEWARSIIDRGAPRVLRDSRENVMKTNAQWVAALGGTEQFIEMVSTRNDSLKRELHGTGGEVANAIIGGTADAVGSIFGGMTGGIATVVTGSIKAVTGILTSLIDTGEVRSFGRNDIGGWKPTLERATLNGDVNQIDRPPSATGPEVPVWFCRSTVYDPQREMDLRAPTVQGRAGDLYVPRPEASSFQTAAKVVLGVGAASLLGAGLASAYKYWKQGKSKR